MLLCKNNFFSQNNLFYTIPPNCSCVLTKIQLQNLAIIEYLDFYCFLTIPVMTIISIFSANLKDSLMIYLWKV